MVFARILTAALKGDARKHFEGSPLSFQDSAYDDFLVKVPALKKLLCRGGFRHRWPLTRPSKGRGCIAATHDIVQSAHSESLNREAHPGPGLTPDFLTLSY